MITTGNRNKASGRKIKYALLSAAAIAALPIHSAFAAFQYWIPGGNGTWSTSVSDTNWAAATGGTPAIAWTNSNNAVFDANSGTPGVVNVSGEVLVSGANTGTLSLSFLTGGWELDGGSISSGGSNFLLLNTATGTVTINSAITTGSASKNPVIYKTGAGTLVLGGANTTTGAFRLGGGTIIIPAANTDVKSAVYLSSGTQVTLLSNSTTATSRLSRTYFEGGTLSLDATGAGADTTDRFSSDAGFTNGGYMNVDGGFNTISIKPDAGHHSTLTWHQGLNSLAGTATMNFSSNVGVAGAGGATATLSASPLGSPGGTDGATTKAVLPWVTVGQSLGTYQGSGVGFRALAAAETTSTWTTTSSTTLNTANMQFLSSNSALTAPTNIQSLAVGSSSTSSPVVLDLQTFNLTVNTPNAYTSSSAIRSAPVLSAGVANTIQNGTLSFAYQGAAAGAMFHVFSDLTVSAAISANVLVKDGDHKLTLSNTGNTLTGVSINGGTLSVDNDTELGAVPGAVNSSYLTIGNGATLAASGSFTLHTNRGMQIGASGTTEVNTVETGTIDVANSATLTYGGVIGSSGTSGALGNLIKTSAGTLLLTGINTYNGTTTVSGGMLSIGSTGKINAGTGVIINGSTANFNFNSTTAYTPTLGFGTSGGTLSGAGIISAGGGVIAGTNAVIAPGNSPGVLKFTTGLTFNLGGTYLWNNNGGNNSGQVAGIDFSQIAVTAGAATINTGANLSLSFNNTTNFTNPFWGSTETFDLIHASGSGSVTGTFANGNITISVSSGLSNAANTLSQGTFSTAITGGDLILTWTPAVTTTSTTYTLGSAATSLNVLKNGTTTVSCTISNTGTGTSDTLNFTGLGLSADANGNVTGSATSGGPLAIGGGNASNIGQIFQGTGYGNSVLAPGVSTATNATVGGNASLTGTTATTINVGQANADNSNSQASFGGTALTAAVSPAGSYANLSSRVFSATVGSGGAGALNTEAVLLAGTSSGGNTVTMTWRTRTVGEVFPNATDPSIPGLSPHGLVSDVVRLSGMTLLGGQTRGATVQTDDFVLQMSYSGISGQQEANQVSSGGLYLSYLDPADTLWTNAVLGNFTVDGNTGQFAMPNFQGGYTAFVTAENTAHPGWTLNDVLGSWGVDINASTDSSGGTIDGVAWAVLDHNSDFAVVVPEPASLALLGLGAMGLLARRRRR